MVLYSICMKKFWTVGNNGNVHFVSKTWLQSNWQRKSNIFDNLESMWAIFFMKFVKSEEIFW